MRKAQSGNALWLILLAIFLLGGLTVLLSRTGGNTEETGSTEQVSIQVSELFRYASGLEAATQSLLQRDCSENQLSFYYADEPVALPNDYLNPSSTPSCEIFNVQGAGMTYKLIPEPWTNGVSGYRKRSHFTAGFCFNGMGKGSPTTCIQTETDLVFMAFDLKQDLCLAINNRMGIINPSGNPPIDEIGINPFIGSYTASTNSIAGVVGDDSTASAAPLKGKRSGCFEDAGGSSAGINIFYHILVAR